MIRTFFSALVVLLAMARTHTATATTRDGGYIACKNQATIEYAVEFFHKTGQHPYELTEGTVPE
jgi:hypothetical protein